MLLTAEALDEMAVEICEASDEATEDSWEPTEEANDDAELGTVPPAPPEAALVGAVATGEMDDEASETLEVVPWAKTAMAAVRRYKIENCITTMKFWNGKERKVV